MKPRFVRPYLRSLGLPVLVATLALGGCDDPIEPRPWADIPDTAALYSLARAEYVGRPGAYDFLSWPGRPVVLEDLTLNPFGFDVAVTEDDEGNFQLLPTGYFPDATATPGILADSVASFEGLSRAPSEGYTVDAPVEASTEVVYVVRSRSQGGCRLYGKMEVLEMTVDGVVTIRTLINRNCNDRSLVPNTELPEDDEGEGGT